MPQVERLCQIEGCSRKHQARGYCQSHYQRYWEQNIRNKVTCNVEDCTDDAPSGAKGYCWTHHNLIFGSRFSGRYCRVDEEPTPQDDEASTFDWKAQHRLREINAVSAPWPRFKDVDQATIDRDARGVLFPPRTPYGTRWADPRPALMREATARASRPDQEFHNILKNPRRAEEWNKAKRKGVAGAKRKELKNDGRGT